MVSFDEYKNRISIIQVAEDLGYKLDPRDGKNKPVYKLKNSEGEKIDEIIIKNPNNSATQHYYDRNYNGGDLICFIKQHIDDFPQFQHSNLFVRLNMILSHYANIPYIQKYESYSTPNKPFDKARYIELSTTVNDLSYLTNERCIDKKTIETFLPFIIRIKDTQGKGDYSNIAFPFRVPGNDAITNYELRNYGFKGFVEGGNKRDSVWIADFSNNPNLVNHIYLAESAIDALSYYELNISKINLQESAFISIGGYITDNQIANILAYYKKATVHSCFDNDLDGHIYDIKVHCAIAKQEIKIIKQKEAILFETKKRKFSIPNGELSIERFRQEAHTVAPLRVHKPKGEKDWNEALKNTKQQKLSVKL